jgi:hypothetical protein
MRAALNPLLQHPATVSAKARKTQLANRGIRTISLEGVESMPGASRI